MFGGLGDASFADLNTASSGQDDVNNLDPADLVQYPAWFISQPRLIHSLGCIPGTVTVIGHVHMCSRFLGFPFGQPGSFAFRFRPNRLSGCSECVLFVPLNIILHGSRFSQ